MVEESPALSISKQGEVLLVVPSGSWTLSLFEKLGECAQKAVAQAKLANAKKIELDASQIKKIDTSGAQTLTRFLNQISENASKSPNPNEPAEQVSLKNFSPESKLLFEMVREREAKFHLTPKKDQPEVFSIIAQIGRHVFAALKYLRDILSFLGQVSEGLIQIILKPRNFRLKELFTQLEDSCVRSIPVVSLVTFLIGIVIAYLMAIQVQKYGGNIFVVNGVALAMCRELSPIIVAVVMAGRSGSAYTAQIGAMRLNEEVDAITVLGLSPMHVLVIPRLLALMLSMPLLVFLGDIIGMGGGMFICESYLGISYVTFIDRLQSALPIKHFIVGMIKAPVFAAVIALIGCRRGLSTETNARSVGLSTTATVVESIVLVILINAAFAVIFTDIGI